MSGLNNRILFQIAAISILAISPFFANLYAATDPLPIGYIADSFNEFGFSVFQEVRNEYPKENIFISPLSLALATATVYIGAEGSTKEAISQTLHISEISKEELNMAVSFMLNEYQSKPNKFTLEIANAIWMSERWEFKQEYLKSLRLYYQAEAFKGLNLENMNDWIKNKTKGKLKQFNIQLDPWSAALIVNTIYYKSKWIHQFNPKSTADDEFFLCQGGTEKIQMMKKGESFIYHENNNYQAIELPFTDNIFSMFIVLPKEDICVNNLTIDSTLINEFDEMSKTRRGRIHLPKFKIKFEAAYNKILSNLGMEIAFDVYRANLTEMAIFNPENNFYVENVMQNTFLEVNEEGVEASAATVYHIRYGSAPPPDPFTMIINRPFLLAIRDIRNGLMLFMGAIYNPKEIE